MMKRESTDNTLRQSHRRCTHTCTRTYIHSIIYNTLLKTSSINNESTPRQTQQMIAHNTGSRNSSAIEDGVPP